MNRAKMKLSELRAYLQRDRHGSKLLDAVSREMIDQRKRIASLEEEAERARNRIDRLTKENAHAQTENISLSQDLETQTARVRSLQKREEKLSDRIREFERETQTDDPISDVGATRQIAISYRQVKPILKKVRKKYKGIPAPLSKGTLRLEDIIQKCVSSEFEMLGMLVALVAWHNIPVGVTAEHTVLDMPECTERDKANFFQWFRTWLGDSEINQKIADKFYGPSNSPRLQTTASPFARKLYMELPNDDVTE